MEINPKESTESLNYSFTFDKDFKRNAKLVQGVHSNGKISIKLRNYDKIENAIECVFTVDEYNLKGTKEPLIFNPTKWIIDIKNNISFVRSKEHLRLIFNKFKNKNRRPENMANLLVVERLFFHTPLGFENAGFSNGPYLTFFLNYYNKNLEQDDLIIFGPNWYSIPINLPFKTIFRCKSITKEFVIFEGWISLDEETLDKSLTDPNYRRRALDYHFSKDFIIESKINVCIDISTTFLHSADFKFKLKGEQGKLEEEMSYEIKRINNALVEDDDSKIIRGRYRIVDPY